MERLGGGGEKGRLQSSPSINTHLASGSSRARQASPPHTASQEAPDVCGGNGNVRVHPHAHQGRRCCGALSASAETPAGRTTLTRMAQGPSDATGLATLPTFSGPKPGPRLRETSFVCVAGDECVSVCVCVWGRRAGTESQALLRKGGRDLSSEGSLWWQQRWQGGGGDRAQALADRGATSRGGATGKDGEGGGDDVRPMVRAGLGLLTEQQLVGLNSFLVCECRSTEFHFGHHCPEWARLALRHSPAWHCCLPGAQSQLRSVGLPPRPPQSSPRLPPARAPRCPGSPLLPGLSP